MIKSSTEKKILTPLIIKHIDFPKSYSENKDQMMIKGTRDKSSFDFSMGLAGDRFCCGAKTLGNFYYTDNQRKPLSQPDKVKVIKSGFEKLIKTMSANDEQITISFTLIDNNACNLIEKALSDGKLFKPIKTFRNLNSGIVNTVYINN